MQKYIIGRFQEVALNSKEYLLDDDGKEVTFDSIDEAKDFIAKNKIDEAFIEKFNQ